jgi:hypothetical protein
MNILPTCQQHRPLLDHDPHCLPNISPGHALSLDQLGDTACATQIDLGLAITKHMDMGRHMIVHKNDHAQATGSEYGDHLSK